MAALDLPSQWPGSTHGVSVLGPTAERGAGDLAAVLPWASLSKVAVAFVTLRLVADGVVTLDDAAGPPGSTLRHLLSHASGLGPDAPEVLASPGTRRIYSNAGYEAAALHLERWSGSSIEELLAEELFEPLGMASSSLRGSAAWGVEGSTEDLARFVAELRAPSLLEEPLMREMTTVQFEGLAGVVPGVGRFDPCDWGVGLEIKGTKAPHWTGSKMGPATVGHFGRAGGFLLFDPERNLGVCTLGDEEFGPWALTAWPEFLDLVCDEFG